MRSRGRYDGDIVLLTDQIETLASSSLTSRYGVKLLAHPPVNDTIRLYALKCQLLDLLPMSYHSILYLVGVAAHPARDYLLNQRICCEHVLWQILHELLVRL
jgi:hypothetical protein